MQIEKTEDWENIEKRFGSMLLSIRTVEKKADATFRLLDAL
jgi:hypothetical protein